LRIGLDAWDEEPKPLAWTAAVIRHTLEVRPSGNVLRQKTTITFPEEGLPLDDLVRELHQLGLHASSGPDDDEVKGSIHGIATMDQLESASAGVNVGDLSEKVCRACEYGRGRTARSAGEGCIE
jgi:hypothetical protein